MSEIKSQFERFDRIKAKFGIGRQNYCVKSLSFGFPKLKFAQEIVCSV